MNWQPLLRGAYVYFVLISQKSKVNCNGRNVMIAKFTPYLISTLVNILNNFNPAFSTNFIQNYFKILNH